MSEETPAVEQITQGKNSSKVLLDFPKPSKILAVLLLCAFGVALFCSLSVTDIWSVHEGRVAGVARNMLDSGNFWVPILNGVPRLEKSPLVYWIVSASGAICGQMSEFSVRLPSLLVGMGCVVVTILIGRTLLNNTVALIAGLVQISTFAYWRDCRTTELDIYLTFFVSLGMLAFCRLYFANSRRVGWVMLFWAALGCGAASKNVLTVLPALITCSLTLLLCRPKVSPNQQQKAKGITSTSAEFWLWHLLGVIIFLIMSLAWNYSMMRRFALQASGLWQRELDSVLLHAHSARPEYFYLANIFVWAFPMSVFVPASLVVIFSWPLKDRRRQLLFLFLWIVVLVLAYSIWPWGKKKIEYIQPMISAFALLTGLVWNQLLTKRVLGGLNIGDQLTLAAHSLLLIACGLTAVGFSLVDAEDRWIVAVIGVGLISLGLFTLLVKAGRVPALLWGTVGASLAAMIVNFIWFLPSMNTQVSPRIFAQVVAKYGGQPGKVFIYNHNLHQQPEATRKLQGLPPLNFYLGYDMDYLTSPAELKAFVAERPSGLIITTAQNIKNIQLEDLGLKILYQQDIDRPYMPLTTKRLPQAWQGVIERALAKAQGPAEYTLLLGTAR